MMATTHETAELERTELLARARQKAEAWGYWCQHATWGEIGGTPPFVACAGPERMYRCPPQWETPEPFPPEADENTGLAVQRAYIHLPQVYRNTLRAEFCLRPFVIPSTEHDLETWLARKSRVSIGAYRITVTRSLLALANAMKRRGLWVA